MTHRKPKLVPILALCAISMHDAAGQLLNGQFVNAKLKNNQRRIYTVLVLPAQFNVPKFGAAGSEGRWREADLLEDFFRVLLRKELATHGARVLPYAAPEDQSDEACYALADLQRKYDMVEAMMLQVPKDVTRGRFTLGEAMDAYAPAAPADTVVFIRGRTQTYGGWALYGHLGFVDARSGEILALIEFAGSRVSDAVIDAALINEHVNMYSFLGPDPFKRPGAK